MANYAILFENTANANYAYNFTKSVLESGHKLDMLFCYKEGVNLAISAIGILNLNWQELLQTYDFKISLCSATATKTGLADILQTSENAKYFELAGISSFLIASAQSDVSMQF